MSHVAYTTYSRTKVTGNAASKLHGMMHAATSMVNNGVMGAFARLGLSARLGMQMVHRWQTTEGGEMVMG